MSTEHLWKPDLSPGEPSIIGERSHVKGVQVYLAEPGREPGALDPRLEWANHSPSGLEWGYLGSGPSQLALAILGTVTDRETALTHYQRFKEEVIATIPQDLKLWSMELSDVLVWLTNTRTAEALAGWRTDVRTATLPERSTKLMTEDSTALVPIEQYTVLQFAPAELKEAIQVNLSGEQMNIFDLDRVRIPTGGGTTWVVPTAEGEMETKAIEGVLVYMKTVRAYWVGKYEGGSEPPQCTSDDGIIGIGDPGGACARCPYAEWGSKDGDVRGAQACKQMRLLFLVRPDALIPIIVALPPTSLVSARKYLLRLSSQAKPYYGVVTKIGLEKAQNKGGLAYSRVVLSAGQALAPTQIQAIRSYAEALRPAFERTSGASFYGDLGTEEAPA